MKEMIAREPTRTRRKHTKTGYKNTFYPKHVGFHVVSNGYAWSRIG
jgi:hypothetical protein